MMNNKRQTNLYTKYSMHSIAWGVAFIVEALIAFAGILGIIPGSMAINYVLLIFLMVVSLIGIAYDGYQILFKLKETN